MCSAHLDLMCFNGTRIRGAVGGPDDTLPPPPPPPAAFLHPSCPMCPFLNLSAPSRGTSHLCFILWDLTVSHWLLQGRKTGGIHADFNLQSTTWMQIEQVFFCQTALNAKEINWSCKLCIYYLIITQTWSLQFPDQIIQDSLVKPVCVLLLVHYITGQLR